MAMVTLYNTISADGFVARKDGSEDFIPDSAWDDFIELLSEYDAVVMGRKTYETIQKYPDSMARLFERMDMKRVVVSRDANYYPKQGYGVLSSISEIPRVGERILLTSGPTLNSAALEAGVINRVIFTILREKIGEGLPVFQKQPNLRLQSTKELGTDRKRCTYSIDSEE